MKMMTMVANSTKERENRKNFSLSPATSSSSASTSSSPAATEAARATAFPLDPAAEVLVPAKLQIELKNPSSKRPFPPWLRGELWRVGPGCFPQRMNHLFDGFAMAAKLRIDGGGGASPAEPPTITHQQRFLETRAWRAFRGKGKPAFPEFGTPVPVPQALIALAKAALGLGQGSWTDNASVTIRPMPIERGKEGQKKKRRTMLAATESVAGWVLLDAADLSTLRNAELLSRDGVAGELTTAHAQEVSSLGGDKKQLVNLVSAIGGDSVVVVQDPGSLIRTPVASLAPRRGQSPLLGRPWVHEFPSAGRYAVVPEGSLPMDLVGALTGGAKHFMFDWRPELGTRYHVVDLEGNPERGNSSTSTSTSTSPSSPNSSSPTSSSPLPVAPFFDHPDPNFYFHVVNAFVDAERHQFVFDVPAHGDASMLDVLSLQNLRSNAETVTRSRLTRVRVPLPQAANISSEPAVSSVSVERLFGDEDLDAREPFFFEFPSPNPRFRGDKDYRYAWGLSAVMPTSAGNALAKVDVSGKEEVKVWHEAGCLPGEPLMIPRKPRKKKGENLAESDGDEDNGVVLSLVVGADGGSFLLVLDAASMEEIGRARLGVGLPYGFHCCWIESESDDDDGGE